MARAAVALRIWSEAAASLERVLALSTERADQVAAHLARGSILDRSLGDAEGARKHYEKALLVHPDQPWPYLGLAELDLRVRRWSRAIAHVDHGLELCKADTAERPWLLLVKAIARQRVSVSLGPQSTFFRGLQGGQADDGERIFRLAQERIPALAGLSYREWLADTDAASRFVREGMPTPPLD
jgi:tetratricopeptide (TPR) repeat protein